MNQFQSRILDSCLRLLRPLAKLLLRHGLTTYDFSRIANIAFVRAAEEILHEQGKSVSFSRVSAVTGLHRHVVSQIAKNSDGPGTSQDQDKDYRRNRLGRVLAGWYEDPDYTDRYGKPIGLRMHGPTPSFAQLVRTYSGDIYPKIILEELLQVGAARILKNGSVRVVTRHYTVGGADLAALAQLGTMTADLLGTLEHNISSSIENRRFIESVGSGRIRRAAIPLLRRLMRQRGTAFLEDVEGWVAESEGKSDSDTVRAGVMVQMYVDETPLQPARPKKRKRRR